MTPPLSALCLWCCLLASVEVWAQSSAPVSTDASWSMNAQATFIEQAHGGFASSYSGPNSLAAHGEHRETTSADIYLGTRLWSGAEAHADGLFWQGFGLSGTEGVEAFPNGEAFRLGRNPPGAIVARLFLRQTIALGTDREPVAGDSLDLAGTRPVSRLTLTVGKISAKDIFDNNSYANDPRSQFMSWALMANEGWDYPADSLGFTTGFVAEVNQADWAVRVGWLQVPRSSNSMTTDMHLWQAWGAVLELERRFHIGNRPGVVRWLVYDNRARMGSYRAAWEAAPRPADIIATRAYRHKRGVGLNLEGAIADGVGWFSRLGWSDGRNEAWVFSDVDYAGSLGLSLDGKGWHRAGDTFAVAGVVSAASGVHRRFLAAGGTGILAGDGALDYASERLVEVYYQLKLASNVHATVDAQYVGHPAFNRARGPVPIFGLRLHWEH